MASENSAQEKTEDPTPKRMEKAFEDGQVLSSKELFVFSTLFTGLILYFLSIGFAGQILGEWGGFFNFNMSEFEGELSRLHLPSLKAVILAALSDYTEEQVTGREARKLLSDDIRDVMNLKLEELEGFGGVEEVLLTSYVMQ